MLAYEIQRAKRGDAAANVIVLLHGRGSNRHDLFGLRERLPEEWTVIAPEAPFPAAPWGYGPGSAWYRFLGRNRPEPESFSASLRALAEFLGSLPEILGAPPAQLTVGGFSQGGTLSLGYALSHPGRAPNVLNFSGFLADHPEVAATPETVKGSRFFWGHGHLDGNIPFDLAIEGRAALREAGADLTERDYGIGHWIDPVELQDAIDWINAKQEIRS
jgi:phospholipase/carboxylesterase